MTGADEAVADGEVEAERQARKLEKARRLARFGYPVLRTLVATWRTEWRGVERFGFDRAEPTPAILTVWHEALLPGAFIGSGHGMAVMISQHGDGEIIAKVMQRIGYRPVRGSSTRGGARALIEMLRVPREVALVVTPDGPRGPAGSCQDGVLMLASKAGRKILPTGLAASRTWRAKSWDRMIVPKPFAKVVLFTGEPVDVPAGLMQDPEALALCRQRVTEALDEARRRAADIVAGLA